MHLSNLDTCLNTRTSSTAETAALAFATTHEEPFPLPTLQIAASAAQTDGNWQNGSARFVAVLYWKFLDNSGTFWTVHSVV